MPDLSFKINADTSGLKKGLEDARGQINRALGSIGGIGGLLTAGGVATADANGKARPGIAIFNDIRSTLAGAANDYRTTAGAAEILGRSVEDLYPFLRASDDQVAKVTQSAQEMGLVMSEEDVKATLAFAGSMQVAAAQGDALAQHLTGTLIPVLGNVAEAALNAWDMVSQLATVRNSRVTEEDSKIPFFGGVANEVGNLADLMFGRPT